MWVRCRRKLLNSGWLSVVIVTVAAVGCSKPEEVISSRIALANQKLTEGEADGAIDILEKLNARHPDRPVVLESLGFAYAQANRHGLAAASFVKAADGDPASTSLRQLAAEAFFLEGLIESAAEQHRLYLSEFPGDFQSWEKLGRIEERRGDLIAAIDAYLEWYRIRPNGAAAYALGSAFRRLNNTPQATAWFEAAITHREANVRESLLGLLELEIESGNLSAAERTVRQLDANFPGELDGSPLEPVRGRIAAWREAEATLDSARAGQAQFTRDLQALRREQERELAELSGAGFQPLAEPTLPQPVVEEPQPVEAVAAPDTPAAERPGERPGYWAEALQEAADDLEGSQPVAATVPPVETPPEPVETEAPSTTPAPPPAVEPPPADLVAAIELRERGDTEGAIDALWRALDRNAARPELWLELAEVHRATGELQPAQAYALEARRRAPGSIEVETAYLNIVRESERPDVYLTRIQAARQRFPANANLAYVFARELAANEGDAARTVAAFEDFLLLADPGDPRRAEAAEFLARARRR